MRQTIVNCLTCVLLALFAACARPSNLPDQSAAWDPAALPSLARLDAMRGASSSQAPIDVTTPLDESNTSPIGGNLGFAAPAGQIAYAVYRIQPPVDTVVSIAAGGADGLYLLVADYGTGHWTGASVLAGGLAIDSLSTLGNPLSPGGYVYCAVVAPPAVQGQLSSLALNYNGPAHVYYVATPATGGNDANPGTAAAPWATLQYAADNIGPDTLVIVQAGDYAGFALGASGNPGQPIIFHAEPGVVLDGGGSVARGIRLTAASAPEVSNIVIEGFTVKNYQEFGIYVVGNTDKAHDITLRNNTVTGCNAECLEVQHADNVLVEGNTISGCTAGDGMSIGGDSDHAVVRHNTVFQNASTGISFYNGNIPGGDNNLDDELISANTCYGNGASINGSGITADGLTNSTISNNLLYANPIGVSFTLFNGFPCTNDIIANNTVVQGAADAVCVSFDTNCTGNKLVNNILFRTDPGFGVLEIASSSLTGFLSDNNIVSDGFLLDGIPKTLAEWQTVSLQDAHSLVSTPELTFVNPVLPDYHLLATASAVGAALATYAPADDLDGVARPQGGSPDCGCYEFVP